MRSASTVGPTAPGLGVLVVDEYPEIVTYLQSVLGQLGHTVWPAGSGAEALAQFREHRDEIDIALLDGLMPGMDGPETLAALRAVEPALPCCFMTGNPGRYTAEELLALGVAYVFPKPLAVARIDEVLRGLASGPPTG